MEQPLRVWLLACRAMPTGGGVGGARGGERGTRRWAHGGGRQASRGQRERVASPGRGAPTGSEGGGTEVEPCTPGGWAAVIARTGPFTGLCWGAEGECPVVAAVGHWYVELGQWPLLAAGNRQRPGCE